MTRISLYDNPADYAAYTRMDIDAATKRCQEFKQQLAAQHEASKYPECHTYASAYEAGEYEAGISAYVYCDSEDEDCEITADANKSPFAEHLYADFDNILMFAGVLESDGLAALEHQLGMTWSDFLAKELSKTSQMN